LLGLLLAVLVGLILDLPQQRDDLLHVTASRDRTGAPRIMKSTEKIGRLAHKKIGRTRERPRTGARPTTKASLGPGSTQTISTAERARSN
jgi:hypothetical protein